MVKVTKIDIHYFERPLLIADVPYRDVDTVPVIAGFLEKLSRFVVATAEQTKPLVCARGFLPLSALTLRVDLMLESGPLSVVGWILLGNPELARLILNHLGLFPPEPIGSALEFDTLHSWD